MAVWSKTLVPHARDETTNCASDSRSYAVRTVPRATPSCVAKSTHDGSLAPGTSIPFSIAPIIPNRICSEARSWTHGQASDPE
jgi:hypothetical protein